MNCVLIYELLVKGDKVCEKNGPHIQLWMNEYKFQCCLIGYIKK